MAVRAPTFDQPIGRATARERRRRIDLLPYALLIPSITLIVIIILYPLATGLYYSLNEGSLLRLDGFVGLDNYLALLIVARFPARAGVQRDLRSVQRDWKLPGRARTSAAAES